MQSDIEHWENDSAKLTIFLSFFDIGGNDLANLTDGQLFAQNEVMTKKRVITFADVGHENIGGCCRIIGGGYISHIPPLDLHPWSHVTPTSYIETKTTVWLHRCGSVLIMRTGPVLSTRGGQHWPSVIDQGWPTGHMLRTTSLPVFSEEPRHTQGIMIASPYLLLIHIFLLS